MATVSWVFGSGGFRVQVAAHGCQQETELNGDLPTSDITLSFTRLNNGGLVPSTTTIDPSGNTTTVAISPIAVRAVVNFADEGHLDAHWIVTRDGVTGKGSGKGIGKTVT